MSHPLTKNEQTIYILSKQDDVSAYKVMKWITHFERKFHRINNEDELCDLYISISQNLLEINKVRFSSEHPVWIRKGQLPFIKIDSYAKENEFRIIKKYILDKIERSENTIGSMTRELEHNKILDLELAAECGIKVPKTYVVSTKALLDTVLCSDPGMEFVIKPAFNYYMIDIDNKKYRLDIAELKRSIEVDEGFFPSLIQEKIEKKIEIRSFYIKGTFYSMAIFYKGNQSDLTYKNVNHNNPNRMVPFELPSEIEEKLTKFCQKKNINCTSIDLIYSKNEEFYFIENNIMGQFDWLSGICNYYIEKKIAMELCQIK